MDATETGSDPSPQSTSARIELPAVKNAWAETSRTSTIAYSVEERSCFVCCSETSGVLVCPCECNARFMHIECQLKVMKHTVAHREGCPVCQSKYRNVHTSRTQVVKYTGSPVMVGSCFFGRLGTCSLAAWERTSSMCGALNMRTFSSTLASPSSLSQSSSS